MKINKNQAEEISRNFLLSSTLEKISADNSEIILRFSTENVLKDSISLIDIIFICGAVVIDSSDSPKNSMNNSFAAKFLYEAYGLIGQEVSNVSIDEDEQFIIKFLYKNIFICPRAFECEYDDWAWIISIDNEVGSKIDTKSVSCVPSKGIIDYYSSRHGVVEYIE